MSTVNQEGGNALADYALGSAVTSPFWEYASWDPDWSGRQRGGSLNLDEVRNASGLIWRPAESPVLERSWIELDERFESKQWGGVELLSPIYHGWRMIARLAVYRWAVANGKERLAESVDRWLRQAFAFARLADASVPGFGSYMALAGFRGCMPGSLDAQYGRHSIWREAKGERWPGRGDSWNALSIDQWSDVAILGFSREIREISAPFVSADFRTAYDLCPKMPIAGTYNIVRTEGGVASWIGDDNEATDDDLNNNTPGMLGLKVETGRRPESLPPDGGPHYRQRASFASVELVDGVLRYHSDAPELGVSSMTIPPGRTIYRVRALSEWSWFDGESEVPSEVGPPSIPGSDPGVETPPEAGEEEQPQQVGPGPEVMPGEIPGKWVVAWPGRVRVLPFKTQDGRSLVVLDHEGDPT